jgi:transcriptional regulator with XRE-family HTH domain
MKLQDYLKKQGISFRQFAKEIGVSHTLISRYCSKERTPSMGTAKKIHNATKGKVTYKDFE